MRLKEKQQDNWMELSLTNDMLFKEILAMKKNRKFLENLLEIYLGFKDGTLKDKLQVEYETSIPKINYYDKDMRNDLIIRFDNVIINIEMYTVFGSEAYLKSEQYFMRIRATQLSRGDNYQDIEHVTQINFIDKTNIKIADKLVISSYKSLNKDANMDIVRLDIARKMTYDKSNKFLMWLKFLGAENYQKRAEIAKGDEILMELNENITEYLTKADDLWWRTFNSDYWNKRIYREDGLIEGKNAEKLQIAKNMLNEKIDIPTISKVTNLSKEEILKLKNE